MSTREDRLEVALVGVFAREDLEARLPQLSGGSLIGRECAEAEAGVVIAQSPRDKVRRREGSRFVRVDEVLDDGRPLSGGGSD